MLDEAAETLKANPELRVYVNGYTDASGTVAEDLLRSRREAEVVAVYLEGSGIPADRLVVQGFGRAHSIETNNTPEGRNSNRRVDLVPFDQ